MNTPYRLIPTSVALLALMGTSALAAPAVTPGTPGQTIAVNPDAPDVDANSYLIAPADQLEISLLNQGADMHVSVQVLPDGSINYPVVGAVNASGLTREQLQAVLERGLSKRYNQPQVTVAILQSHVRKISVTGTVRAPGQYDYRPGLRLMDVIAACGGSTQANELTLLTLVTGHGTKNVPIDLVALSQGDETQNVVLAPGDALLFTQKDPANSMIHVVGQVNKPGDYTVVNNGATVLQMLTQAGGQTGAAALTRAQILHGGTGKVQTIDLHPLKYNLDDPVGRIKLTAGDTLLIPENNNKYVVLGEVRAPQQYYIPDGEKQSVIQALAQAGGATDDGDKKTVGILRNDPKGQLVAMKINVQNLLKGDATVQDYNLQPGDILVVPTRHHGTNFIQDLGTITGLAYSARYISRR